jgi:hypothetical protein
VIRITLICIKVNEVGCFFLMIFIFLPEYNQHSSEFDVSRSTSIHPVHSDILDDKFSLPITQINLLMLYG